jgi:hypothetical protein
MRRLYAAIWIMLATMFAVPALSEGTGDTAVRATIERFSRHSTAAMPLRLLGYGARMQSTSISTA